MDTVFHPEFSTDPYWWLAAKPSTKGSMPVPEKTEIAIVGSGYTGLNAAIRLADLGHQVTVFEAREFGFGASSRNGGHVSSGFNLGKISSSLKPSPMIGRLGLDRYNALQEEGSLSFDYIESLIERENIDCHYVRGGRFVVAYTPRHFEHLKAKLSLLDRDGLNGCRLVSRANQRQEIGSDFFHGGMVIDRSGKLHPALYHRGLLEACKRRGVVLCAKAPVNNIKPKGQGFQF